MPTPTEISNDDRNTGRGYVEEVSANGEDHTEIVIRAQVVGAVWAAALADPTEAANVLAWLDSLVSR